VSVRVDYLCGHCGGVHERRVASPPPPVAPCVACGADARRMYSPVGVLGRAGPPGPPPAAPSGPAACVTHPDVPALCHLDPSVATAWIARARGDTRTLERELARQESEVGSAGPGGVGGVGGHHHHRDGPAHIHRP
jgi:hypothetical protein